MGKTPPTPEEQAELDRKAQEKKAAEDAAELETLRKEKAEREANEEQAELDRKAQEKKAAENAAELETLRKEKAEREANEEQAELDRKAQVPAQVVNHNKKYSELKMDVEVFMKKVAGGGEELDYYVGEPTKQLKTVMIEPKRADQLNRTWHSRKIIYWPADEDKPAKIKRTWVDSRDGGFYKDEIQS